MSDTEWANKSLRMAIQNVQDAATKPLHARIEALEAALRWAVEVHTEPAGEIHDFAWVKNARSVLAGSQADASAERE